MDLRKKINLYYGENPLEIAPDSKTQEFRDDVAKYRDFCAVIDRTEVPEFEYKRDADAILGKFGVGSEFAKDNSPVMGFYVTRDSGLVVPRNGIIGGFFFNLDTGGTIIPELESRNYKITNEF